MRDGQGNDAATHLVRLNLAVQPELHLVEMLAHVGDEVGRVVLAGGATDAGVVAGQPGVIAAEHHAMDCPGETEGESVMDRLVASPREHCVGPSAPPVVVSEFAEEPRVHRGPECLALVGLAGEGEQRLVDFVLPEEALRSRCAWRCDAPRIGQGPQWPPCQHGRRADQGFVC